MNMSGNLSYSPGSEAQLNGQACTVMRPVDITRVLVRFRDSGETTVTEVSNLQAHKSETGSKTKVLDSIPEADLKIAQERFDAIKPLLDLVDKKGNILAKRAKEVGTGKRTLERWINQYSNRNLLSDLAPDRRGRRKKRLGRKVEAIIREAIETVYLTKQKVTAKKVIDTVIRRCKAARLKPPCANTIRSRIKDVSVKERTKRRHGAKAARDKYAAVKGPFPGADHPLAVVQIDHTKLDINVVDDERRQPIGRPWLTLAIDVYSRMVTGLYVSLDAPSAFSVGMCMCHSILPKDAELSRLGIDGEWPVWGVMRTLHADNGKDFRSNAIQKSCDEYGISMEWRPVRTPHFGGHIERMLGTISKEIHALPGTTFSNIQKKGEYDSEKLAALTFDELYRYLIHFITGVYHLRIHKTIGMPPIEKWRDGILGNGRVRGTGHPEPVHDQERLRINFLPHTERTVQREGIVWDNIHYYSDALRPWINAIKGGRKVKFTIRRDPRDISKIYFLDPDLGLYLEVPYRDITKPSVSIWDCRKAKRSLKDRGWEAINEDAIFATLDEMESIAAESKKMTNKARREEQRKKLRSRNSPGSQSPYNKSKSIELVVNNKEVSNEETGYFDLDEEDLKPNWEEWT